MKKYILILFLFATSPALSQLASEGYNYAEDTQVIGAGGGTGWSGSWTLATGADKVILPGGIQNGAINKATASNSLQLDFPQGGENVRMKRRLENAVSDDGNTYWLSFMTTYGGSGAGNVMQVMLVNFDAFGASGGNGQLVRVGKGVNGLGIEGVGTLTGTDFIGTHWIVLKVVMSGDADAEQVFMFLDPDPSTEPQEIDADLTGTRGLNDGFDGIGVKIEGSPGLLSTLDDIYLGNDFSQVIPVDWEDFFPSQPAVESFDYGLGTALAGQGTGNDGWRNGWTQVKGNGTEIIADTVESEFVLQIGHQLQMTLPNTQRDTVTVERQFFGTFVDDSSTVWLSFIMSSDDLQVSKSSRLELLNGDQRVLAIGGLEGLSESAVLWNGRSRSTGVNVQGRNWYVAKVEFSGDEGIDSLYLWVNPDPTVSPLEAAANVTLEESGSESPFLNQGFDRLRLALSGFGPFAVQFDEIRIGFSFGDVSRLQEEVDPDLLAQDRFTYGAGESLTGQGFADGQWAGPWQSTGSLPDGGILSPGNVASELPVAVKGNKITLANTQGSNVRYVRLLDTPVEDDGNEYWLSVLMNFGSTADGENVGQLFLYNSTFTSPADQRLAIGKNFNEGGRLGFFDRDQGGSGVINSEIFAREEAWLVMKLKMSGDAEADSAWLWLDPDPESVELDTAMAITKVASISMNDGFDGIFLKSEGTPPLATEFDEIRLGTTYASVSPTGEDGGGGGGPVLGLEDALADNRIRNYPNPFYTSTTIVYTLSRPVHTQLSILTLHGKEVRTLENRTSPAGTYEVSWDGTDASGNKLPTGMYFYRLQYGDRSITRRLIYLE